MGRWSTRAWLTAPCDPRLLWDRAYADVGAWPDWDPRIRAASVDGPLRAGARVRAGRWRTLRVVEFDAGTLLTHEARLPGARLGHRRLIQDVAPGLLRLTDTVYVDGALSWLWARVVGRRAGAALPAGQEAAVAVARAAVEPQAVKRATLQRSRRAA
jgi:NADPH-dependent 2,4-dienoyl-CoA reductase/sulfur reductase-like enzyme